VSNGSPERGAAGDRTVVDVLDRALDGVTIVRQSDGTIVYANIALKALLGASPGELKAGVSELVKSGRTSAVEVAHPDLGAIRLIVIPRDARRSMERSWRRDLRHELARARRRSWPLSVAAVALDAGGGTQLAAAAWGTALRGEDSLAPYEAGVYLIVLPDCPLESADSVVAARIREATPAPATASIGLAEWTFDEQLESLASRALEALASARSAGGDQVAFAPAPPTSRPGPGERP
jgi:PAS domain-containing protein